MSHAADPSDDWSPPRIVETPAAAARSDDWSPPRIVAPHTPAPIVVGEMKDVRRSWRRQRRARMGRRVWPLFVVLLLAVIITAIVLLSMLMQF